jgi:hypothetical protein
MCGGFHGQGWPMVPSVHHHQARYQTAYTSPCSGVARTCKGLALRRLERRTRELDPVSTGERRAHVPMAACGRGPSLAGSGAFAIAVVGAVLRSICPCPSTGTGDRHHECTRPHRQRRVLRAQPRPLPRLPQDPRARPAAGRARAMREITLTNGERVTVYDTSGPYSEPSAMIDVRRGLPDARGAWIDARGDTEHYPGRIRQAQDDGVKHEARRGRAHRSAARTSRRPSAHAAPRAQRRPT